MDVWICKFHATISYHHSLSSTQPLLELVFFILVYGSGFFYLLLLIIHACLFTIRFASASESHCIIIPPLPPYALFHVPLGSLHRWLFSASYVCHGVLDTIKELLTFVRRHHLWCLLQSSVTEFSLLHISHHSIAPDLIIQRCPVSSQ